MARQIYALFTDRDGERRYFYVGKSHNPELRMRQHAYNARSGKHEDVYNRIRELTAQATAWDMEVRGAIGEGDYEPDAERFEVIRLVRKGHLLMNMRHGSRETQEEAARQVADLSIRSVADVRRDRERVADGKRRASRALRRRIQTEALEAALRRGIPDVAADMVMPPVMRRRLLAGRRPGDGAIRIPAGEFKLNQFVRFVGLKPSQWLKLNELGHRMKFPGY